MVPKFVEYNLFDIRAIVYIEYISEKGFWYFNHYWVLSLEYEHEDRPLFNAPFMVEETSYSHPKEVKNRYKLFFSKDTVIETVKVIKGNFDPKIGDLLYG